jgi:hypothetical protein
MKIVSMSLLLSCSLFLAANVDAQKKQGADEPKLYRWVDENGEVHFSESLPPDFADKEHDVLDNSGMVRDTGQTLVPPPPPPPPPPSKEKTEDSKGELPRDKSGMRRPAPRYSPAELKVQQNALLLLRYDTDQEILDALDVEIKQLDYDRIVLATAGDSLTEAYRGYVREAAERQRAGIPVEDKLISDIADLQLRVADNNELIAGLRQRGIEIKKDFMAELIRYRKLVEEQQELEKEDS